MSVHVHIQELVFDGVAPRTHGTPDFESAMRAHLRELLQGSLSGREPMAMREPALAMAHDGEALGRQVAEGLHPVIANRITAA